jgi:hypothetical protein
MIIKDFRLSTLRKNFLKYLYKSICYELPGIAGLIGGRWNRSLRQGLIEGFWNRSQRSQVEWAYDDPL